jgi:hypothetical protein
MLPVTEGRSNSIAWWQSAIDRNATNKAVPRCDAIATHDTAPSCTDTWAHMTHGTRERVSVAWRTSTHSHRLAAAALERLERAQRRRDLARARRAPQRHHLLVAARVLRVHCLEVLWHVANHDSGLERVAGRQLSQMSTCSCRRPAQGPCPHFATSASTAARKCSAPYALAARPHAFRTLDTVSVASAGSFEAASQSGGRR